METLIEIEQIDEISEFNQLILRKLPKVNRIDESFDFDKEFAKGLTVEEFRAEMKRRIRNYPLRK